MPNENGYLLNRIEAWMTIGDDNTRFNIGGVSAEFAINSIPTCKIDVAVGVDPNGKIAKAHQKAKSMMRRAKVAVYLDASGDKYEGLPHGPTKIFDGYLSDIRVVHGTRAASLSLVCIHWLSDLATGHKLNGMSHPTNASNTIVKVKEYTEQTASFAPEFKDIDSRYKTDLWGGIKAAFNIIAASAEKNHQIPVLRTCEFENTHKDAVAALNRMDTEIDTMKIGFLDHVEYAVDHATRQIGRYVENPETGSTFWDTLRYCANTYQFVIVPNVEKQSNLEPYKVVHAEEYTDSTTSGGAGLPLRGVGLVSESSLLFGTKTSSKKNGVNVALPGYFDIFMETANTDQDTQQAAQGQVKMFPAPTWVKLDASPAATITERIRSVHPATGNIRTESTPDSSPQDTGKDTPGEVGVDARSKPLCDSFQTLLGHGLAKLMYLDLAFGNRKTTFQNKLRFDIAPGSLIALETVGKKVPLYGGADANRLYGCVRSVGYVIDAEHGRATTTIEMQSVRTQKEHDNPGMTVTKHPIYTEMWQGTYLVSGTEGGYSVQSSGGSPLTQ
jgi:hypothetical protein